MNHTIRSRQHGLITFWMPDKGGYVRMETGPGEHGCLGKQICYGGGFRGATVEATPETMADVCTAWWRKRREFLND